MNQLLFIFSLGFVTSFASAEGIVEACKPAYRAYQQCLLDNKNVTSEAPTAAPTKALTATPTKAPTAAPTKNTEAPVAVPIVDDDWDGSGLTLTHYWDCSGQACDSRTLQPWDYEKYRSPLGYQPQDPDDFGGSVYGEKLWVTAAIMNIDLGPDDPCCGTDDYKGCGKCLLISNPNSTHPDWTVLAMKKNTGGIGYITWPHVDVNAPGYDDLEYSWANICGEQGTGLSERESSSLGKWYNAYSNTRDAGEALCGNLPAAYQKGCKLFSDWGWTGGMTTHATYRHVECPEPYKEFISGLFDENGVVGGPPVPSLPPPAYESASPTASPTATPESPPAVQCGKKWEQCGGKKYGDRCCEQGTSCVFGNTWYSQCIPI
jgi:hypothetical protein